MEISETQTIQSYCSIMWPCTSSMQRPDWIPLSKKKKHYYNSITTISWHMLIFFKAKERQCCVCVWWVWTWEVYILWACMMLINGTGLTLLPDGGRQKKKKRKGSKLLCFTLLLLTWGCRKSEIAQVFLHASVPTAPFPLTCPLLLLWRACCCCCCLLWNLLPAATRRSTRKGVSWREKWSVCQFVTTDQWMVLTNQEQRRQNLAKTVISI